MIARTSLLGPGFVKLLFHGERLVGATIAGDQAGELIAPLSLAMAAGLESTAAGGMDHPAPHTERGSGVISLSL